MSTGKPRVLVIPFGYPDYPQDLLRKYTDESVSALAALGLDVASTPMVVLESDVPGARKQVRESEADLYVPLVLSWIEVPLVPATLQEIFGRPMLLWTHTTFREADGGEADLGSVPGAGVVRQTLEEMGVPFKFIYGQPDEADMVRQAGPLAAAAHAVMEMGQARIGLFGYASMGMYTGTFDHTKLRRLLGPEVVHFDQYTLIQRAEKRSMEKAEAEAKARAGRDKWELTAGLKPAELGPSWRVYEALEELVGEGRLDAVTIKCQYEMSRDWGLAPCLPLSILGDKVTSSCEGDVYLSVSQLILHYLSGGTTIAYGDVHTARGRDIILGACGFAPLSHARGTPIIRKHTALYEGVYNGSPYKEGTVTLARVANDGAGYKLHATAGEVVDPPRLHEVGCPPYSWLQARIESPIDHFMQNLSSQHYAIAYGDWRPELAEFCRLKGLRLVLS
jgi:L-fucose isomerase-like protein